MKIKSETEVSNEVIENLICNAMEGGSNYWYFIKKFREPKNFDNSVNCRGFRHISYPMNEGGSLSINCHKILGDEAHSKEVFVLNLESIQRGLEVMASKHGRHFKDAIDENDDAVTADVFLQCCLFGEVIYV